MRKVLASAVTVLVINFVCATSAPSNLKSQTETQPVAKVKAKVNKLGVGKHVEVKVEDGTTLKGRISAIAEDYFVVVDTVLFRIRQS